jgi:hypothetical protein
MSIREFHSRLTLTHEQDALMIKLRRLSMVDNPDIVIAAATEADGPWIFWNY